MKTNYSLQVFLSVLLAGCAICAGCGRSETPVVTAPASTAPATASVTNSSAADVVGDASVDRAEGAGESVVEAPVAEAPVADEPTPAEPTIARAPDAPKFDPQVVPAAHTEKPKSSAKSAVAKSTVAKSTVTKSAVADKAKPKFDPVEVNGKYFEGWPKPQLTLVISGRQDGYLEPCGCAGLDQQKGGLSRRHTLIKQLQERGWPLASLDVGGLVRRFGRQAEIQFGISAEALKTMGYSAVGFGPADLRLSAGEIVAAVAGADPKDSIFVSANVNLFDLTPRFKIVERGGVKLGITSVLGQEYRQQVNNAEVLIEPAAEALAKVVGQLKDCDARVLLAYATVDETKALAKQFPQFEVVVTADGPEVPPRQPPTIPGTKTRLVEMAPKAMYAIVVGLYDDAKQPLRFERVALDSRFADSPEMLALKTTYQDQLRELGWKDLGLKSVPHPKASKQDKLAGQFAGAASCKECHPTAWGVWSKTKHAHATETLAKLDPPRQFDPECISCHATGWNPQEFVAYQGGFDSLEATPLLAGNGCENCHGPAAAHVSAEKGRSTTKKESERQGLKLTAVLARDNVCTKCHDHDNSPDFNDQSFEAKYWPKVEHKGKR